jgi:hypothetical protein
MTRAQLEQSLMQKGVRRDAYTFDADGANETYVLNVEAGKWVVFYAERGLRTGAKEFASESAACDYLYELLLTDSNARRI